jgi:hypothetical protein
MRLSPAVNAGFVLGLALAPPTAIAEPPSPAPAPTVAIVGHVAVNGSVALPGIVIQLAGATQKLAVTDASGSLIFRVPPGSYVLKPPRGTAATFTPEAANLANLTADVVQDFTCAGNCVAGPAVVPSKELVITDPSVVNDARTSSATAGQPWSFRFLIEQMAPVGSDPADFMGAWLAELDTPEGAVNGFPVDVRKTAALRALWPTNAAGKLDLARAPFRLLAITNRIDLHATGNGEARLIYGAVDPSGAGRTMTVAFEFELPAAEPRTRARLTRADWAAKFHALGRVAFGATYNASLQAITDLFTRRDASPARVGGSAIRQVRSNEALMGEPCQLREFRLTPTGAGGAPALRLSPTPQTPADAAVSDGTPPNQTLLRYLGAGRATIHGAYAAVPESVIGGQASASLSWTFSAAVDPGVRHDFAGQTCNGCHSSESGGLQTGGSYHVSPTAQPAADGTGRLSSFVKLIELGRRTFFLQNVLTCSGWTCAAGAEPSLL